MLAVKLTFIGYSLDTINRKIISVYRKHGSESKALKNLLEKYNRIKSKWDLAENSFNSLKTDINCRVYCAKVRFGASGCNFIK